MIIQLVDAKTTRILFSTTVEGKANDFNTFARFSLEDLDGDGDIDLVLHFRTADTGIQCGDISASVTAQTISGQRIEGFDSVKTTGCK